MTLLILAAGLGSRFGAEKQYVGVGPTGEYLLEYNIYDAITAGFKEIVVVTNEASQEALTKYLQDRIPNHIKLTCVVQSIHDIPESVDIQGRTKPWGTAHAVRSAREVIHDTFVTINADDFYGRPGLKDAFELATNIQADPTLLGIVTYQLSKTISTYGSVSRGVCEVKDDILVKVVEHTQIRTNQNGLVDEATAKEFSGEELVSMNLWVLKPTLFDTITEQLNQEIQQLIANNAELYLPSCVQHQMDYNSVTVLNKPTQSDWMGLTYQEDRAEVVKTLLEMVAEGTYPTPLWK